MEYIIICLLIALMIEVYYVGGRSKMHRPFAGKTSKQLIFVDTSVLIDGRILEVAASGFVPGILAVPRSVVGELQFLADNADAEKRAKARHGLDVIQQLKAIDRIDFTLFQDGSVAKEGVDERLLKLARENNGVVLTLDFNLNKVAAVEGIPVLNINELAQTLRMAHLPGEQIMIDLVQKGQDSHQAVGYLADGTMVVVENAQAHLGKKVEVEVIRSLQTAAGKMMFAKLTAKQRDQLGQKKPTGKQPIKPQAVAVAKKILRPSTKKPQAQQEQKNAAKPSESQQRPSRSRRRPRQQDKEDILLDLVDKQ